MATAKKAATKKSSNKRTTIAPNNDKRYVKRDEKGQFKESDDVGKSLSQDRKQTAKKKVQPGFGDQGDQAKKGAGKKAAGKKAAGKKAAGKKAAPKKR